MRPKQRCPAQNFARHSIGNPLRPTRDGAIRPTRIPRVLQNRYQILITYLSISTAKFLRGAQFCTYSASSFGLASSTKLAKVFELHFNPKAKEDKIFDSFLFEPENILERRLGNLYLVGELSNVLPQNLQFLERLSSQIKKEYYRVSGRSTDLALRESLRKANEFLSAEAQKGNVGWLGNLNFAALSLQNSTFNFTKVGSLKISLLRSGEVFDIGKDLEFQEIEPYPLKIFGNIVSGKLSPEDKIIIFTKDIFRFFSNQNLIEEIAKLETIEEKGLSRLVKNKEDFFRETSGVCLLIDLKEEPKIQEKITFGKIIPLTSWKISLPRLRLSKFVLSSLPKGLAERLSKIKFPLFKFPTFKFPKLQVSLSKKLLLPLKNISSLKKGIKISENIKLVVSLLNQRNLIIISALIFVLLIGNFIFSLERAKEIKRTQSILTEAKSKMLFAENAFIFKDEERANLLYQEALQKILPQVKQGRVLEKEVSQLKKEIEEKLFLLNKLEQIAEPEILFDFQGLNFIPQKMVVLREKLYFFSPVLKNFYQFSISEKKGVFIETDQKLSLAAPIENKQILFYSRPDVLFFFEDNQQRKDVSLKIPYPNFYFNSFTNFQSNLYFLDSKKGEIIKYVLKEIEELSGNLWLSSKTQKPVGAKSLAVDGSIWILNGDNSIDLYYTGQYQESLTLDFFPYPKNFSKILAFPNLPYLWLLEPIQKRIVILNKSGQVIKQFQSNQFDNLKDFTVSADGKTLYLLNGLKLYQIKF